MVQAKRESFQRWYDSIIITTIAAVIGWIAVKQYDTNARVVRLETKFEDATDESNEFSRKINNIESRVIILETYVNQEKQSKIR